jgi:hypothetical protein
MEHRFVEEEGKSLVAQLELLFENMMHSLEYSLEKKEILPLCEVTANTLFTFIEVGGRVNAHLVDFCLKLIKAGENYLIFQRAVALTVTQGLTRHFEAIVASNFEALVPLMVSILSIEEYRGFDSAVYCYDENRAYPFYH